MKLTPQQRVDLSSATITQALGLILLSSAVLALSASAAAPAWWSTRGAIHAQQVVTNSGVVSTNYITNDYAKVTQGQLKQFTARGADEMNANLSGGAGTNLNSMVSNWISDYTTNGYGATNIKPSDYTIMDVGQLKYIGNKVWSRLVAGGYTNALPSWLALNTNTDGVSANVGQLKQVFNFVLPVVLSPTSTSIALSGTSATINWTESGSGILTFTIRYSVDGGATWATWTTAPGTATSASLTGLPLGVDYQFRIIANTSGGSSSPSASITSPFIALVTPPEATLVP